MVAKRTRIDLPWRCRRLRGLDVGFRLFKLNPAWRTSDVVALARGIYADRAFDRMPILGDALEDAGCADTAILDHCRDGATHARGCWLVDLILGTPQ